MFLQAFELIESTLFLVSYFKTPVLGIVTSSQNKIYKCNPDFNFLPPVLQANQIRKLGMKYCLRDSNSKRTWKTHYEAWDGSVVRRKSPRLNKFWMPQCSARPLLSLQAIYCLLVRAERARDPRSSWIWAWVGLRCYKPTSCERQPWAGHATIHWFLPFLSSSWWWRPVQSVSDLFCSPTLAPGSPTVWMCQSSANISFVSKMISWRSILLYFFCITTWKLKTGT